MLSLVPGRANRYQMSEGSDLRSLNTHRNPLRTVLRAAFQMDV